MKNIYKILDGKSTGYFTSNRWKDFYNIFLSSYITCDTNRDCLLDKDELDKCLDRPDTAVIKSYNYDSSVVTDIINSLDNQGNNGLNFEQYMLMKRIVIGFRQYNVNGYLDKNAFVTAFKTTFADRIIDEMDSELAFRMGVYLMQTDKVELSFIQYFEVCRIVSNYYTFGVTIGEGYVTRNQLMTSGYQLPSKVTPSMYEKYFNLFTDDKELHVNLDNTKIDPDILKFEDFCSIDFWVNIMANYTDPSSNNPSLNVDGFEKLAHNKYFKERYITYITNSNFEDMKMLNNTIPDNPASNNTDFEFLTNFNFLQVNNHKSFLQSGKTSKVSVFEKLGGKKKASLFDQFQQAGPSEGGKLESELASYFKIMDLDDNNLISFDEFIVFIKYLQAYDKVNHDKKDSRGIISSNAVNGI
jgi:Ca2+-binding EF-hand superfamily protein